MEDLGLSVATIFPINVKAPAGSLMTLVSWSCFWIVTYTFDFMLEWSSGGTFFIFAGVYVVTILFIAKIVTKTRGRTLEDFRLGKVSPEAPTTIILRIDSDFSVSKKCKHPSSISWNLDVFCKQTYFNKYREEFRKSSLLYYNINPVNYCFMEAIKLGKSGFNLHV